MIYIGYYSIYFQLPPSMKLWIGYLDIFMLVSSQFIGGMGTIRIQFAAQKRALNDSKNNLISVYCWQNFRFAQPFC